MTALSGGGQPINEGRSPSNFVLERPGATPDGAHSGDKKLGQNFPASGDPRRDEMMQKTWTAFCTEMTDAVKTATGRDGPPSGIAYAVGEIVHNYFRARGATLTSYELRHLVAELLDRHSVSRPDVLRVDPVARAEPAKIVEFEKEPPAAPWQGEEPPAPPAAVPEKVFEPPRSMLVELLEQEDAAFDRLLANAIETARPRIVPRGDRGVAWAIIDAAIDEVLGNEGVGTSAEMRQRLGRAALSELCGLGLIDRLWADHAIHAVYVNGPAAVFVDRNGTLERAKETFRDEAHLTELVGRLTSLSPSGVREFQLRDGTSVVVVFPPAAPRGPVLAMRRAEPGSATFERLIAADVLSRGMADLLRIAARCRLNVLVSGAAGSGKTALLAALARDMDDARLVTVARHRAFRSSTPTRVELVAQGAEAPLPALLAAAASLRPDLLIVDSVQLEDAPALVERLSRGSRGTIAAVEPVSLAAGLSRSVDLVVRLARGRDGLCRVVSMQDVSATDLFVYEDGRFQSRAKMPAFAGTVRAAGLGEVLAAALR